MMFPVVFQQGCEFPAFVGELVKPLFLTRKNSYFCNFALAVLLKCPYLIRSRTKKITERQMCQKHGFPASKAKRDAEICLVEHAKMDI